MTTPTLHQLDIFAQLVASGSVAECAALLNLPAPDIIRNITALEDRLGHRLFDMTGGMARLTGVGRTTVSAMQRLSEATLEQWNAPDAPVAATPMLSIPAAMSDAAPHPAVEQIAPFALPLRQQVIIATHPAIFSHFQEALDAFEQSNGDVAITLDLDVHTAAQATPLLKRGRADIAYYYALGDDDLDSRYAWSEPLALYIGEAHPLAGSDIATVADVENSQSITLLPDNSLRHLIDQALEKAGVDTGIPLMESDNLFTAMTAVREGAGYFAAFGPLARDFARMAGIKRLPLEISLPAIDVRQAVRHDRRDDPIVASLAEYLFR